MREAEALLLDLKSASEQSALSKKIAESRSLLSLSAIAIVGLGLAIVAIYAVAVLFLVTRADRPTKKRERLTGRGGDFE